MAGRPWAADDPRRNIPSSLRAEWGRQGAAKVHSEGKTNTRAARRGFTAALERQVDPDGTLSQHERSRRAEQARSAHMAKMRARSVEARSQRAKLT